MEPHGGCCYYLNSHAESTHELQQLIVMRNDLLSGKVIDTRNQVIDIERGFLARA
ncbi:hypothetical protein [Hahella sp. NBU794]|uniref:hypothetical protein n=1 Tax=Hahella sp. NBU794 TaxID=3422590 RepID=UPI003D6F2C64